MFTGRIDCSRCVSQLTSFPRVQCCFTSTETVRTIRDGDSEPRTSTSTFTQLLSSVLWVCSMLLYVHRDRTDYQGRGEPRTSTSTFTQLLGSEPVDNSMLLYVHGDRTDCWGGGGVGGGRRRPGRPPRLSHSSWPLNR